MSVDKKLIQRKISLIRKDLNDFKKVADTTKDEFLKDRIGQLAVERYLEIIIGRMIDINFHIITKSGSPAPEDYYSSFIQLKNLDIIDGEKANEMANFAGLRNVLAHEYNGIDENLVWKNMQLFIKLLPEYLKGIKKIL